MTRRARNKKAYEQPKKCPGLASTWPMTKSSSTNPTPGKNRSHRFRKVALRSIQTTILLSNPSRPNASNPPRN